MLVKIDIVTGAFRLLVWDCDHSGWLIIHNLYRFLRVMIMSRLYYDFMPFVKNYISVTTLFAIAYPVRVYSVFLFEIRNYVNFLFFLSQMFDASAMFYHHVLSLILSVFWHHIL